MLCYLSYLCHCLNGFFFFQAEDGIRDLTVTGVQTCALPIYAPEQVREGGEVTRPIRLEMIQRLERLAQRRKVTGLACIDAKPGAQRLQRHASQIMVSSTRWTGVAGRQRALRSCPRGASGSAPREIGLRSDPSAPAASRYQLPRPPSRHAPSLLIRMTRIARTQLAARNRSARFPAPSRPATAPSHCSAVLRTAAPRGHDRAAAAEKQSPRRRLRFIKSLDLVPG